jgi:hypothetical protein
MPRKRVARPIVLQVETPIVHPVAARVGDLVILQPGTDRPVVLVRDVPPNYGALLGHVVGGTLSPRGDSDEALAVLEELARLSPPPAAPRRRRSA